jgi:hypothetical protein
MTSSSNGDQIRWTTVDPQSIWDSGAGMRSETAVRK